MAVEDYVHGGYFVAPQHLEMYGCFDGCVVYGVMEEERERMLDAEWLQEHYPEIQTFASDVVRNYMGSAVYGNPCELRPDGTLIAPNNCDDIDRLGELLGIAATFHVAVFGDYEHCQERYRP